MLNSLMKLSRGKNGKPAGRVGRELKKKQEVVRRAARSAVEQLEARQMLAATAWPEVDPSAWPSDWTSNEIEAKWHLDEPTLEQMWTDLQGANITIGGVMYTMDRPWPSPRRFTDAYYDMPNDELADDSHVLRHRQRHRLNNGFTASILDPIDDLLVDSWRATPDYHRVQYKSTPERFGAPWFRLEAGSDTDLTITQVNNALNGIENPFVLDFDDPVTQAEEDHPGILWNNEVGGIDPDSSVRAFRTRVTFLNAGVETFEMSLDKVRECDDDGFGNLSNCGDFFEIEIEVLNRTQTNVSRLFDFRDFFEDQYNDSGFSGDRLIPSITSKGGASVPDHGAIQVDDGDGTAFGHFEDLDSDFVLDGGETQIRLFSTTGTWTNTGDTNAYGDDYQIKNAGTGSAMATWTFDHISPGRYKVGATWISGGDRATNATYLVFDDTTLVGTVVVNQQNAPSGHTASGNWEDEGTTFNWQNLGDTFYIGSGKMVIKLSDAADGKVVADATRIQHVDDARVGVTVASGALSINGTSGADSITLGVDVSGYVTLDTGNGAARIQSAGADVLATTITSILVEALEGNDTVNLSAVNATNFPNLSVATTIAGGAGNDAITGTALADSILGETGDDQITGGAGNDTLNGGTGNDTYVYSGSINLGSDTITEGGSADADWVDFAGFSQGATLNVSVTTTQTVSFGKLSLTLTDGTGIENVNGSAFNDNFTGNSRDNCLFGNGGADTLRGGTGNDTLFGGASNDWLFGDAGNDALYGDDGNINAGTGADRLEGGADNDLLQGDRGNDTYAFSGSGLLGSDTVNEAANLDVDTLDFSGLLQAGGVNLAVGGSPQTVSSGKLTLTLSDGTGLENVYGTAHSEGIYGNSRDNLLVGNAGNDTVFGGLGNDTVHGDGQGYTSGQDGNDTLGGDGGNDVIYGDAGYGYSYAGSDLMYGGADNDTLWGDGNAGSQYGGYHGYGEGNDTIIGETGNDVLYGDTGVGWFTGYGYAYTNGAGNDYLIAGDGADVVYGDGLASLYFTGYGYGYGYGYGAYAGSYGWDYEYDGDDTISDEAGNDTVYGDRGVGNGYGGYGEDTLYVGTGNDYLHLEDGSDIYVFGWSADLGTDTIAESGGFHADTLDFRTNTFAAAVTLNLSQTGNQTVASGMLVLNLLSGSSMENVKGTSYADSITGNSQNNYLWGYDSNDTLRGGTGFDTLEGSYGNDDLRGEGGGDTYRFGSELGQGSDVITELDNVDTDTLDFSAFSQAAVVDLGAANTAQTVASSQLTLTLASTSGDAIENVIGSAYNDSFSGNTRNNSLLGNGGHDTLHGLSGSDTLRGGAGNDYLDGGIGTDWVFGDGDNDLISAFDNAIDTIDGGLGTDTLLSSDGNDVISNVP